MNLSRVRLVADNGDHYLMHDGSAEFRVPKRGLSESMHQRIQSFAGGGKVESEAERKARKQAEYEEETDSTTARTEHTKKQHEPGFVERAGRAVTDFARQVIPAAQAATTRVSVPARPQASAASQPARAERDDERREFEVQRAHGGSIPGYAEGSPYGVEMPERRDAGPVVFVPSPDGGLRPVPASQLNAAFRAPTQAAPGTPAFTPGPPQMSTQPAPAGPSPEAQAAVRKIYETTGPAGAAALNLQSGGDFIEGGQQLQQIQRDERSKLTTLKPRVDEEPTTSSPPPPTVPPKPTAPAPRGYPAPDYGVGDMTRAVATEQAALEQKGNLEAQAAKQNARIFGAVQEQLQANAIGEKQRREQARIEAQQLGAQRDALTEEMKRVNTKVDSGRYWASKSTGSKILTAIGLALGSIGAGRDGVNRAALLMGQAIDRDIEAQKAEATLAMHKGEQRARQLDSIYAQNRAIYQDDLASLAASKATALELADSQLKQAAATYASPIAKQNALALSAQLQGSLAKFKAQADAHAEEGRHHRALESHAAAAAAAKGAGLSNEEKGKVFDVTQAAGNIRRNIDRAKAIIGRSGTMELTGTDQTELESALGEAAQDWARMRDPGGTVKEDELRNAKKQIGVEGGEFWTRNSTALKLLNDFAKGIDDREDMAYQVRGLTPPVRKKKP